MTIKDTFVSIVKENIHRDGIDDLLFWLENNTDFYYAPASTKYHLNYPGGLLTHSLNVYNALKKLCVDWNIQGFTDETLAIVGLFHDLCKSNYYSCTNGKWGVNDVLPLGHGEKSIFLLQRYINVTDVEALAIRWHMCGFDSAVKGGDYGLSSAQGMTKLVCLLQVADQLSTFVIEA